MQELIKVTEENGQQLVSARELYDFLGYDKSQWSRWSNKNIVNEEYFTENQDYQSFDTMSNGNLTTDYIITIDVAKELSMMARTEKGKEARQYFINCEKKLKEIIQKPLSVEEMIVLQAQSMIDVKNDIQRLENKFDTVVTLESGKQRKIQIEIASRVYKLLPEPQPDLDNKTVKEITRSMFSNIHRDIKRKFGVASYKDIKVVEYEKALSFIENWIEDVI